MTDLLPLPPAEAFAAAVAYHRRGELPPAEQHYVSVLRADPDHLGALHNLGLIRLHQGRAQEAAALIRQAIALKPGWAEAHNNLGSVLQAQRRLDEAVGHFERAVALAPNLTPAHLNLATTLLALGRPREAGRQFEAALRLEPGNLEAQNGLGSALHALGRHEEAIDCFRTVLAIDSLHADAHNNWGNALLALGRAGEAVEHYRRAVALDPDLADAHYNLGNALHALDRTEEAVAAYQKALALRPDDVAAYNNLGNTLQALRRHREALPCYERAIALAPDFAAAHSNLGTALHALDRPAEALAEIDRALSLRPDDAAAHSNKGDVLREIGEIAAARQAYEAAIAVAPRQAGFHLNLAQVVRFSPGEPHLAALEELAREADALPPPDRIALHFALGKAYADIADYRRSFAEFRAGNTLQRRHMAYDETGALALFDRIAQVFTRETMADRREAGDPSPVPIFIVGMPRSGTTLVEQILASHRQIHGAGELPDLDEVASAILGKDGFPEAAAGMSDEALRRLGGSYAARLTALAPEAARITDKMPSNFLFLGLIRLALPQARIIHVRRDPLDTCISCFTRLFTAGHAYSYDLRELGRYYRAYDRLMAHWRRVLPPQAFIEIQYEALVADLEQETRRLVDYCGLDWDEACLSFYRTRRAVRTASATQVRQPIYDSAIGRARRYGADLAPLREALGPDLAPP